MNRVRVAAAALAFVLPSLCSANTVFTLNTGMTGADTKINSSAESDWYASSFTPNCLAGAGNCTSFSVTDFDTVSVAYDMGGGLFDVKESVNNASSITLSLWDGNVGGTLAAPTGATLVASVTLLAGSVGGSYKPTSFTFSTPFTLQTGHSYVATLTSSAPANAGWFIKTPNSPPFYTIQDPSGNPPPHVPEPSTSAMMAGALTLLVGLFNREKRRRGTKNIVIGPAIDNTRSRF